MINVSAYNALADKLTEMAIERNGLRAELAAVKAELRAWLVASKFERMTVIGAGNDMEKLLDRLGYGSETAVEAWRKVRQ